jgi:kynurenine formamidase
MNQAEYSERIHRSPQYISKLVRSGRIVLLPDGSIDPVQADEARKRKGRCVTVTSRRYQDVRGPQRQCQQCGSPFWASDAAGLGRSPDVENFCTDTCALENAAGKRCPKSMRATASELRAHGWAGFVFPGK